MLKKLLLVLLVLPALSFAGENAKGYMLLNRLWKDMQAGNIKTIKNYTSEKFQSVHQDGARNRAQELKLIANLHLTAYQLTDVKITKDHNVFIISYVANATETINNVPITATSPRLTVFEKHEGKWKWVANANLVALT